LRGLVELQGHPDLRAARKVEALRHDANNGARQAIKRDGSSKDIRVAAQAALPEGIAQDHNVGRMASFFPGRKITSHGRLLAHHPEERCRDQCRVQLLGPFHAGPVCRNRTERRDLFEDPVPVAQAVIIGRRADILLSRPGALADPVDSFGAGIGGGRTRMEFATLKSVVFAPMLTASVRVAESTSKGSRPRRRTMCGTL
jgi:hypothetical protein